MNRIKSINHFFPIKTDEEYRKLAYMFPDYIFLDNTNHIHLAGTSIEEQLHYCYGFLRNKDINLLSNDVDLGSTLAVQVQSDTVEWRSYHLKGQGVSILVEVSCFRMTEEAESMVSLRVRSPRNVLQDGCSAEADTLTYWIAHNLRGPLATIQGLIHLAGIESTSEEIRAYLTFMAQQAKRMEEKIKLMMRLARKSVK
ncbi:MAG TPA: histidine kinase dimerization/phospho-acceptor domain-containing protein [Chryseosolibacter sp.]|nr:histidine kinase dimerization/phospho-acceptor domain-containing protein [Chryseosolibacter sp.]